MRETSPDAAPDATRLNERPPRIPAGIEGAIGALLMALLFLITFANVAVRYLTSASFAFTEEYSVALMVVMVLVGSAAAFALDRHMRVGVVVDRLPQRWRRGVEVAGLAVSLVFFVGLAIYGALYVWDEYRFGIQSPGLGAPQWRYTLALPVFAAVIALRLLGRATRIVAARRARR